MSSWLSLTLIKEIGTWCAIAGVAKQCVNFSILIDFLTGYRLSLIIALPCILRPTFGILAPFYMLIKITWIANARHLESQ
jgi:hypothetical protein